MKLVRLISIAAITGSVCSCASNPQARSRTDGMNRAIAVAAGQQYIQANPSLCPSYAPTSGPQVCDPSEVATEINALPHPINWTGTADSMWSTQHSPCTSTEPLNQLGSEIEAYHENPLLSATEGYWSMGAFTQLRRTGNFWSDRQNFITAFFTAAVNDPGIQNQCCNGNAQCVQKFKQVQLSTSNTTADGATAGEYDPVTHTVFMPEASVLTEIYNEPLQRLVLHELGHACEQSIYFSENPANPVSVSDQAPVANAIAHLNLRLGPSFVACLQTVSKGDNNGLDTHNAQEAFAESIFSYRYKDTLDWISLGGPQGYLWAVQCVLKTPALKQRSCSP